MFSSINLEISIFYLYGEISRRILSFTPIPINITIKLLFIPQSLYRFRN